jgi:hypothetical protein
MRAQEFAEDNLGTNPRRAPRSGTRPSRGHEPVPRYRSMSENTGAEFQVGDPVIVTGNVEYQGKTGDVREVGRDGAFVVVDLYNYGPQSFQASDVSYNDYADKEDELNEFALDDSDDPTEDYPCYDCGSTIFLHHTKLCDLAEPNAKRDLPAKPGSQVWTGQVPKGLAPIPGLEEGVAEQDQVGNMPAEKFDDAMARLKQLAGAGPLKTVWDPQKRVYKNVPTAVQPKK